MKISTSAALGVSLTFAGILAACGGPSSTAVPAMHVNPAFKVRPNNNPYMFVSDKGTAPGSGQVVIYNFPNVNSVFAVITGLNVPAGECVDSASGTVYVTDSAAGTILEFTNNGTYVQTLTVKPNHPVACAVKSSPYRVAVVFGNAPTVVVFQGTGLNPPSVTHSGSAVFSSIAYAAYYSSNQKLYLTGNPPFGEMAQNGTFTAIPITGGPPPGTPGGIQQVPGKNYFALGDASANTVYRIRPNGVYAPPGGHPNPSVYTHTCSRFGDFFIDDYGGGSERVINNPEDCPQARVNRYKFPAGGPPGATFTANLVHPVGVVVSQ